MTDVDTSLLAGQRVLVTGADGFIGSHLVERLVALGAEVTGLCVYNSLGSLGWLQQSQPSPPNLRTELGDIRDAEFVRRLVDGQDIVMHLAALIAIPFSYQAPRSFVDTNVGGTLNVLEACRSSQVRRLVHTSTSEVYGTPQTIPITETHPLRAQSPYSATKIAADQLADSYARSFDLPVVTLRPFNTYGPRQSLRAVIPTIIAQLLAGVPVLRLGATSPSRDFTFVEDTVEGFIRIALAEVANGDTIHLGTGSAVTIGELAEKCMHTLEHVVPLEVDDQRVRPPNSEVDVLLSDPTRAAQVLGWKPTVALEHGLQRTADWMRESPGTGDVLKYHQ